MAKIKIGSITLENGLILAPMAGVTDRAFRVITKEFGCEMAFSEMISAKGLYYKDEKTKLLASFSEQEQPFAIQIFGSEPNIMVYAVEYFQNLALPPAMIDINMGCPMPKIVSNGDGSALMKNPKLVADIVSAVTKVALLPISVKIRTGWDENSINAPQIAKICEDSGASMICVHGRTRKQLYSPPVDTDTIGLVKASVRIPVIANGGIYCANDAIDMINKTSCDGVAIAQGAMGNPWIFSEITAMLKGSAYKKPSQTEKYAVIKRHIELLIENKGEYVGVREARKLVGWYIKGMLNSAYTRNKVNKCLTKDEIFQTINEIFEPKL